MLHKTSRANRLQIQCSSDSSLFNIMSFDCFKSNIRTERRILVLLIGYGVVITLLHVVNIQTIFLIQPKTLQFIQKNQVYFGSRCYGCDDLIQNGVERKQLDEIELFIAVPSAAEHFAQRSWIRETWGQERPSLFRRKAIYFFLGKSANSSVNEAVQRENQKYKDIVQAGFNETYDNLSYKTLSIMYWVHHRVTNGRFAPKWIFKCDDDNLVDIYNFEKYLKSLENATATSAAASRKIYCYVRDDAVPIRPGHNALKNWEKWTVSRESWSEPLYPRCCYGPAYVLTPGSVMAIVDAYERSLVTFSKFEDIYITGVLARESNVTLVDFPNEFYCDWPKQNVTITHRAGTTWPREKLQKEWNQFVLNGIEILKQHYEPS